MELQNLKELLKNHNHVLIDYTDKFIDTDYEISLGNKKLHVKSISNILRIR